MGEVDIEKLHKIYTCCNQTCRLLDLPFQFKEDTGNFETAIVISETGELEKPIPDTTWLTYNGKKLFVPDIADYQNRIIIEFEETPGKPRHGAKLAKKGHDPDGLDGRTANRDLYYGIAKLRVLKIFDYEFADETKWKIKLVQFLIKCYLTPIEKVGAAA